MRIVVDIGSPEAMHRGHISLVVFALELHEGFPAIGEQWGFEDFVGEVTAVKRMWVMGESRLPEVAVDVSLFTSGIEGMNLGEVQSRLLAQLEQIPGITIADLCDMPEFLTLVVQGKR